MMNNSSDMLMDMGIYENVYVSSGYFDRGAI